MVTVPRSWVTAVACYRIPKALSPENGELVASRPAEYPCGLSPAAVWPLGPLFGLLRGKTSQARVEAHKGNSDGAPAPRPEVGLAADRQGRIVALGGCAQDLAKPISNSRASCPARRRAVAPIRRHLAVGPPAVHALAAELGMDVFPVGNRAQAAWLTSLPRSHPLRYEFAKTSGAPRRRGYSPRLRWRMSSRDVSCQP
jgi:hypothetical protein